MKKFLFIMRTPPHSGIHVAEMLDIILTTAAFDQQVSLLLLDDGVFQIKAHQNPALLEMKDSASIYKALEIYDVHDIYVELESLQERGLKPGDLIMPVREIYRKDVNNLMQENDIINGG